MRPISEFSTGMMQRSQLAAFTASIASSKLGMGIARGMRHRFARRQIGIGARLALKGDALGVVDRSGHERIFGEEADWRVGQIGGSIDTERHAVHARHRNAHIRFQRPQLLQLFALFQRRRRQGDKARQRVAGIGINADMMKQRALAGGRGGAGEIERAAQSAASAPRPPPP